MWFFFHSTEICRYKVILKWKRHFVPFLQMLNCEKMDPNIVLLNVFYFIEELHNKWRVISRGRTYAKKTAFSTQKRAGYANLKMTCVYCMQKTVTSHKMRCLFVFCTQQRRFVEHLPWVPTPSPPLFPIASRWRDAGAYVTMFMTPIDTDHAHTPCVPQIKMQLDEVH